MQGGQPENEHGDGEKVETRVVYPAPADLPSSPGLSYSPRASVMPFAEWGFAEGSSSAPTLFGGLHEGETSVPPPTSRSGTASAADTPSGFSMLRLLGRGGMGEVWEAIQRSLWRLVAVKRLRPDATGSMASLADEAGAAFHGEAMTSALLDHPNIVPVYDLGFDENGAPLLAMKYVRGRSWDQIIAADFVVLGAEEHLARHLPILAQVAQAVAFAHSKGVVHRDLKASQVMIGEYGEVLLMDWGLAMMVGEPPQFPGESTPPRTYPSIDSAPCPAGTPGCMAPEQTSPDPHQLGMWTDVYLLGGILFSIMTNQMPHPGSSGTEAFSNASVGLVRSFEEAAPGRALPAELKSLALLALRHVPLERPTSRTFLDLLKDYITGAGRRRESQALTAQLAAEGTPATYAGFVDALTKLGQAQLLWPQNPEFRRLRERIGAQYAVLALEQGDLMLAQAQAERLTDETAKARLLADIAAAMERARLQRRRLRQFAIAILVLVVLVIAGGAMFTLGLQRANKRTTEQLVISEAAKEAEARAGDRAQQEFGRASLLLAESLVGQGRKDEAVAALLRIPEADRFWEWGFVMTRALEDLWTIPFAYLAWSPTKDMAVGWDIDGGLCALRAESGEVLHCFTQEMPEEPEEPLAVWSRDEKRMVLAAGDLPPAVVDTTTWETLARLDDVTTATLTAAEFSPDGTRVALGASDGAVFLLDVADGGVRRLASHDRKLTAIYWGREKLVTISSDAVRRVDPDSGVGEVLYLAAAIQMFYRLFHTAADRDRNYFAFAYAWSPPLYGRVDGGPLGRIEVNTHGLTFSNKQPWLVVSSMWSFPQYTVWNVETHAPIRLPEQRSYEVQPPFRWGMRAEHVNGTDLSENETVVLLNGEDRTRLYSFPSLHGRESGTDIRHAGARNIVLAPHGDSVWVVGHDGKTHIRPLGSTYVGTMIPGDVSVFGPNDAYTLAIQLSWFEQRDVDTGEVIFIGGRIYNLYRGSKTSTDGRHLFLPGQRGNDFVLEKWDRIAGKLLASATWKDNQMAFMLHADTSQLAHVSDEGTSVTMYSVTGDRVEHRFDRQLERDQGEFVAGQFTTPGDAVVMATTAGRLVVWDAASGTPRRVVRAHRGKILQLQFLQKHDLFQTVGEDRRVRLWNATTLEPVAALTFDIPVVGAALSADRTRLLGWPERGAPILRDMASGAELVRLERSDFPMGTARFVADDTRIVANQGGAARFWDPETGREVFNMQSGFGEISSDSRKFIYKASGYDGVLIDIAPSRAEELVGSASLSYRERLDLWMIERFRRWSRLRLQSLIPHNVDELLLSEGTVDDVARVRLALPPLTNLGVTEFIASEEARDLSRVVVSRLVMTQVDLRSQNLFDQVTGLHPRMLEQARAPFPDSLHASAIVAVGCAGARHLGEHGRFFDMFQIEIGVTPLENLAIILGWRGERERAIACARRAWAFRRLCGFVEARAPEILAELGASPPLPPPADLVTGPTLSSPPFVLERLAPQRPDEPNADRQAREKAAWDAYVATRNAWVDSVAPPLDWAALLADEKARPTWQPYPAGTPISELGRQLRADLERLLFDGRTLKQAMDDEDRRVDELFAWRREAGRGR